MLKAKIFGNFAASFFSVDLQSLRNGSIFYYFDKVLCPEDSMLATNLI
jgi:hypothetical protein